MARRLIHTATLVAAAALAACTEGPVTTTPTATPEAPAPGGVAPLLAPAPDARVAEGRYVVVYRDGAGRPGPEVERLRAEPGVTVHHVYGHALKGFAATLTPAALDRLRRDPRVAYVQPDQIGRATTTQLSPPWGLDRIDQRSSTRDGSFTYEYRGSGVRVYVIDSGVDVTHPQFGTRASVGPTFCAECGTTDEYGHGTRVAGVIGASTYGVAKNVRLVSLRVLDDDGDGFASDAAAAVDHVVAQKQASPNVPMVANMSLLWAGDAALDAAVNRALDAKVTVVAGAGNEGVDACGSSPQRVPGVLTVGGTDKADSRVNSSNWGPCVDLYAPGQFIYTTTAGGGVTTNATGTSVAAPHASGFAAMYLEANPTATPSAVHTAAVNVATKGRVSNLPAGSFNRLLFTWFYTYADVRSVTRPSQGAGTLTAWGYAFTGTGSAQAEWRDATEGGTYAGVSPVPVDADGRWTASVPAPNPCYDYQVRVRYSGVVSAAVTYRGELSGFCNEAVRVIWIQPGSVAGPPFTSTALAVAGEATGAPAGTTVKVWWRNATTGGSWTKLPYEPVPDANGIWLHEIPNANFSHAYEVRAEYDVKTSTACTYPGNGGIKWC
jgi:subtilisin family serine protease